MKVNSSYRNLFPLYHHLNFEQIFDFDLFIQIIPMQILYNADMSCVCVLRIDVFDKGYFFKHQFISIGFFVFSTIYHAYCYHIAFVIHIYRHDSRLRHAISSLVQSASCVRV